MLNRLLVFIVGMAIPAAAVSRSAAQAVPASPGHRTSTSIRPISPLPAAIPYFVLEPGYRLVLEGAKSGLW